jgi:hypothetical protein
VARHRDGISKTVSLKQVAVWVFQGNEWAVCEQLPPQKKNTAIVASKSMESLGTESILFFHKNSKYIEKYFKKLVQRVRFIHNYKSGFHNVKGKVWKLVMNTTKYLLLA